MAPYVSVVVTAYNKAPFLEQCLNSLMNQTLQEVEIICIDDGSSDNSPKLLQELAKQDDRITVILQENVGQSAARNRGLALAKGEYITFTDADDFLEPNMLQTMYHTAKKHGADAVICDFYQWDGNSAVPHTGLNQLPSDTPFYKSEIENLIVKNMFTLKVASGTHNRIYSTKLLQNQTIKFNESIDFMEDYLFNLAICKASHCQVVLHDPLYFYRIQIDNSVSSTINLKKLYSFLTLYKELLHIIGQNYASVQSTFHIWAFHCILLFSFELIHSKKIQPEELKAVANSQQVKAILSKKGLISSIFSEKASLRRKLSRYKTYLVLKHPFLQSLLS